MMCFEWMSHGEIDLPLQMVALQRPGVNRRGGGMGDGQAQPEGDGAGRRRERQRGPCHPHWGPSPGLFWKRRADGVCARQLGGPGAVSP